MCTGNICRSPMAAALLERRLAGIGEQARLHSAGLLDDGRPASPEGVAAMASRAIDTSSHRSSRMTAELLEEADLVLCMAREHLREAVLLQPRAWLKAFTLKEIVRRGEDVGPRWPGQPFDEWLSKLHAGRERTELLGSSPADDVADPMGMGMNVYERTATELAGLIDRLVELGWRGSRT